MAIHGPSNFEFGTGRLRDTFLRNRESLGQSVFDMRHVWNIWTPNFQKKGIEHGHNLVRFLRRQNTSPNIGSRKRHPISSVPSIPGRGPSGLDNPGGHKWTVQSHLSDPWNPREPVRVRFSQVCVDPRRRPQNPLTFEQNNTTRSLSVSPRDHAASRGNGGRTDEASRSGLEFKGVRCEIWTRPIRASKRLSASVESTEVSGLQRLRSSERCRDPVVANLRYGEEGDCLCRCHVRVQSYRT